MEQRNAMRRREYEKVLENKHNISAIKDDSLIVKTRFPRLINIHKRMILAIRSILHNLDSTLR